MDQYDKCYGKSEKALGRRMRKYKKKNEEIKEKKNKIYKYLCSSVTGLYSWTKVKLRFSLYKIGVQNISLKKTHLQIKYTFNPFYMLNNVK